MKGANHDLAFDTERLHVRLIRPGDENAIAHLYQDQTRMRFVGGANTPNQSMEIAKRMIDYNQNRQAGIYWYIEEKSTRKFVGIQGLTMTTANNADAEIGIVLAASAEGKWYSYEAFTGMFHMAFSACAVERLVANYHSDNRVIKRMLDRLHFTAPETSVDKGCSIINRTLDKSTFYAHFCV